MSMNDIRTAELSDSLRAVIEKEGISSLVFIPLVFDGKLIGKFMAYFDKPHVFSEDEIDLSLTIAHQLAIGIERKRDENTLRTSEERFRLATRAAQMFSWEFDLQSQTSTVADNFAEAVGFSAGLIPQNKEKILQTFIHPEDAQRIFSVLMQAIEEHKDLRSVQFRILNPENSQPVWLEVNGKVVYDSEGNPERMFGVAQNITESKQTEEYIHYLNTELQAQLDERNKLLEILPTGVWIGNHDCSEITGNPAAYRILGLEPGINVSVTNPEPQVPTGLRIFVNGEEALPEDAPMQVVARSGKPWHGFEHELLFPDGTRKSIYGSVVPLFDESGAVRKVIASYTDFTERKQAENRLALLAAISELTRKFEDPIELMYEISKAVGAHLQVKRCLFNETDLERDVEIVHRDYFNGVPSVAGIHKISDYSNITSAEMTAGKTVVNYDAKSDPRTAQDYERTYAPNKERAYVAVPLMRENQWVGTLWVSDDRPRQWSAEEVSLLETVAERTWTVVEKLRINADLRESEERYRFIVENTSDGIWHIKLTEPMPLSLPEEEQLDWYYEHAVIRQCNLGLAHMYGYDSVEEVLGLPMREVMPRENPVNQELSRQFIRSGYRLVDVESREVSRDGRELVFLNNMIGVIENGKLTGEWGTNRDITERKRVEEERNQLLQREQALRASAEQAKAEAERELAERKLAEAALGEWVERPLPHEIRPIWMRYGLAIAITVLAIFLRAALQPFMGDFAPFATLYGAVAFSVWFGGVGPALLSMIIGYLGVEWFIIAPGRAMILNAQHVTGLGLFLLSNTVIIALGQAMRLAQRHAHQSARVAVERQHQVETQLREKQLVEDSLRQSEALYRGIARSIPGGGVYVVDRDFRYLVAEGPATEAFGLSRAMLEGHTVSEVFPKEPAERMEARLQRNFAGETVDFETVHNGRVYWTQQAPMTESLGNVDHAIVLTIDITERKQMEEALKESERKFSLIFHKLPFAAALSSPVDGTIADVNEAFERVFGYDRQEVLGKTSIELGINPDSESRARILTALQEHGSVRNLEVELSTKTLGARLFLLNLDIVGIGGEKYILQTAQDI
ncbi:MAG TPA: PAS domain S-box protein, partial [Anaerolineales bacterium]|nr:PAS domain S-box protein [Anaerolineales bacterium]